MNEALDAYRPIVGDSIIDQLAQLARPLGGASVVHVNSTLAGGGVAEILRRLVPLQNALGLRASWRAISGDAPFFDTTKRFHNGLQGLRTEVAPSAYDHYLEVNRANAEELRAELAAADFVFIHDPQPAALLELTPKRRGQWIWRCHIDASRPHWGIWRFLRRYVSRYDASVFSLAAFTQSLPHPQYLIAPSIDPLSEKNVEIEAAEVSAIAARFGLDAARPVALQVSRFDRFKDPVGVIRAFRLARATLPLQLVLAGSEATDDPEGAEVLAEVREAAGNDPDIRLLLLPADAHRTINALQRRADLVLQKSLREGFGLTVSEALWKRRAVIGGDAGGIRLQVIQGHTGFLVHSPEGTAMRMRYLLQHPKASARMGEKGRRHVLENFLLTRHLRDYLTLMTALRRGSEDRIELAS